MYKGKNNERTGSKKRTSGEGNFGKKPFQSRPKSRSWDEEGEKPARKFEGSRERNNKSEDSGRSGERKPFRSNSSDRPFKPFRKDSGEGPARKLSVVKKDRNSSFDDGESTSKRSFNSEKPYTRPFRTDDRQGRKFSDRRERTDDSKDFEKPRQEGDRNYSRPFRRDERPAGDRRPSFRAEGDTRPRRRISMGEGSGSERRSSKTDDGKVRLNKIIAASGICSRREADDMISAGLISVNGTIISELGSKVYPGDDIRYNGERLRQERPVYIVMNKPKDYVTTTKDPFAKRTVMELLAGACKERVFPVGRLDRNTTGVLLITNDGDLAKKLTHPSHNKKKIYHVHLDKGLKHTDLESIVKGLELEDGFIKADEVNFIDPDDKKQIGIEIHSGKNRIVRRMFEHLGYTVSKLDRVYFAGLTKKGLQRGQWRFLTSQEVGMLKMGSYQ